MKPYYIHKNDWNANNVVCVFLNLKNSMDIEMKYDLAKKWVTLGDL